MIALPKRHTISPLGHSADISLRLHVNNQILPLRQTGTTEILLRDDVEVPIGPARVEIVNDGRSHFSDVTILGRQPESLWLNIR